MRHLAFIFLLVGCGTAQAQDVVPTTIPTDTGSEIAVQEPVAPPTERTAEDTLPPLMSEPTGAEILLPLAQGGVAPFPGVLLNVHGVAWLEAEPDAVQQRAQAWADRRISQIRLLSEAELERLRLRIRTLETEHQIIVAARDQQISSLNRINDQLRAGPIQWWENVLYIGGALVVGAIIGLIAGFASN